VNSGKSLRPFLADGTPGGLLTAAIVAGRPVNGRVEWLVRGTRRTYGHWQTEGVEEAMQQEVGNE
jgi:hypothetical protein